MPTWLEAGLWGLVGGGALVLGALIAWFAQVSRDVVATVMAFGAGVLISAVAFDLMEEAEANGGLPATAAGFLAGALIYLGANAVLARHGAPTCASAPTTSPPSRTRPAAAWRSRWAR